MAEVPTSKTPNRLRRTTGRIGPWSIALTLSFVLLAVPTFQLFATLLVEGNPSEVNKAVISGLAARPVRMAVLIFVAGLLILHAVYAALLVLMARITADLRPSWREQTAGFTALWFCLATAAVLALNGLWFPRSESGAYYHPLASAQIGGIAVATVLALVFVGAVGFVVLAWLLRYSVRRPSFSVAAVVVGVAVLLVSHFIDLGSGKAIAATDEVNDEPHIIVLGIDSLRLAELARNGGSGKTPHLDEFLAEADIFTDVTTPVARTFPSWVALLTGRPPRETGAIFNLVPRPLLDVTPAVAQTFQASRYQTVLATDEVRFSNIDSSYGFDQMITPPIGASDFLLGRVTDMPLTNVVANTWIGGKLFPYTHANRAAAKIFKPRSFLQRLEAELEFDRPTLFVAHLCAAHWPYFVAGVSEEDGKRQHDDHRPLYDIGLRTADDMFGQIVAILERKGALENAIVVVLSDHGEALAVTGDSLLGEPEGHMQRVTGLQMPVNVMDWGHGQSVLSPVQYQTLLGFRTFGVESKYRSSARTIDAPVTLMDISPTLVELAGLSFHWDTTGYSKSLKPLLVGWDDRLASQLQHRARFTETDLRATANAKGDIDESAAARANSIYFAVNPESGRLELLPEVFPVIMAFKERAALLGPYLLAALPADLEHHQYLLLDRLTGQGRVLERPPTGEDPAAYAIWQELHREFEGELLPPTVLQPEQLAELAIKWHVFLDTSRNRILQVRD